MECVEVTEEAETPKDPYSSVGFGISLRNSPEFRV